MREVQNMKPSHRLMTMVALVSTFGASSPSPAAPNCLSLELHAPATMCAGQTSWIGATVTNSCPNRLIATAQLAIDGQNLPFTFGFPVAADSSRTKAMGVPVPASATTASHTLTVSLTDSAGDATSASIDVSISSCTGTTSGQRFSTETGRCHSDAYVTPYLLARIWVQRGPQRGLLV